MMLPFYRSAQRLVEGPLAYLTGIGVRLALVVLVGVCGAIDVALRLLANGAQRMSTSFDVEAGIKIVGGLAALAVVVYALGIVCWAFVVSVSRRPIPRHDQSGRHARYSADEQSPNGFCIVMFDTDDYVYVFRSVRAAQDWIEPLTVDEVDAIFDNKGQPLQIVTTKGGYALRADPAADLSLQRRIESAHSRGNLLDVDETLPTTRLTSLLLERSWSGNGGGDVGVRIGPSKLCPSMTAQNS